jgi:LytR cell envelope-related transcriptional attenuator
VRRLAIVLGALVALVLAGIAGAGVSSYLRTHGSNATTTTVPATGPTTTTTVPHSGVAVLVVNGTLQPNAAGHYTQVLKQQGWSMSPPTNATSQVTKTTIYYVPNQLASAQAIASELGVSALAVQPMTSAVPVPSTTGLDVAVVIGPDLAGQGFPPTT